MPSLLADPSGIAFKDAVYGFFDLGFSEPGRARVRICRAAAAAAASAEALGRQRNSGHHPSVTVLHRIDRIGHRDMHHRQIAQPRIVADVLGRHHGIGSHVPVSDDIGARGRNRQARQRLFPVSKAAAAGTFDAHFIGILPRLCPGGRARPAFDLVRCRLTRPLSALRRALNALAIGTHSINNNQNAPCGSVTERG